MNYYIAHNINLDSDFLELYESSSGEFKKVVIDDLIDILETDSTFIYLLPCSKYSSYKYNYDNSLTNTVNEINFISNIEDIVVSDISSQKIYFYKNEAYIIDKNFIANLNTFLSNLKIIPFIIPEHTVIRDILGDIKIDLGDEIFLFNEGIPYRLLKNILKSNIEIQNLSNPEQSSNYKESLDKNFMIALIDKFDLYPNFFKFNFSLSSIKSHLRLSFTYTSAFILSICLILLLPIIQTNVYERDITKYEDGINQIFKSLDKNIVQSAKPRKQIDLLADNFNMSQKNNLTIPNINFIERFGIEYIDSIEINVIENNANIYFSNIPSSQLNIFLTMSETFNISIINQEIDTSDNKSTGFITIII